MRKKRSDAGVPRNSTLDAWYDRFMLLTAEQQRSAIAVLTALNRQFERGALSRPRAAEQLSISQPKEEQEQK